MSNGEQIRLHLLGPLSITANKPVQPLRRKTRALLAYLAATNQPHSRQHLMGLFCAEAKDPAAVLRSLLSRMRRISADILVVAGDLVRLNGSVCWVDCLEFEAAVMANDRHTVNEQFAETLALYQGDFLSDLSLEELPEFELWLLGERARFRTLLERGLRAAVSGYIDAADWGKAIHFTQRLVTTNPLLEEAHGRLIWLYAQTGQLDAARAQYDRIRHLLAEELAVEPAAELQRLYADIQTGKVRPQFSLQRPEAKELSPVSTTAVIGRDNELAHLQQAWRQAQKGQGRVIMIEAEAGGGKSYLVHQFGRQLPPGRYLYGDGYESTQIVPYTAWLELLSLTISHYGIDQLSALPAEVRSAIAQLLPEMSELNSQPPLPTERLFTALATFLLQDQPRLLFIDNLQWADSATLNLFHFLARRTARSPVVLVGAFRPSGENQPLAILLDDLHRMPTLHLKLEPLESVAIESLLAVQWPKLPQPARPQLSKMLCSATAGNPLFLTEIIRELAHTSAVPDTLPIPPSVLDLIRRRLRRFPTSVRQVVESLAVLHAPGLPELLQQISGRSEDETVTALDVSLAQGLIAPHEETDHYDFRHDLMREAVRSLLSNVRLRLLHKRAAQALEPTAKAAVLAYHWQKAGNREQEAIYAIQAGEEAMATFALDEGISFLTRARELVKETGKKIYLSRLTAEMLISAAKWQTAEEVLLEALAMIPQIDEGIERNPLEMKLKTQLGIAQIWIGSWERAEETLRDALELAEALNDLEEKAHIHVMIGQLMTRRGLQTEAHQWLSLGYETSRLVEDKFGMSRSAGGKGILHMLMEQNEEAMLCFQEALALATEINEFPDIAVWLGNIGTIHHRLGNLSGALSFYERSIKLDRQYGIQNQEAVSLGNIGNVYREMGNSAQALQNHLEALEIRFQLNERFGIAYNLSSLAEDYLALGDYESARLSFLKALEINLALGNRTEILTQLEGLGRVYQKLGRLTDALEVYKRALRLLEDLALPSILESSLAGKAETERMLAEGLLPEPTPSSKVPETPELPTYVTNNIIEVEPLLQEIDRL